MNISIQEYGTGCRRGQGLALTALHTDSVSFLFLFYNMLRTHKKLQPSTTLTLRSKLKETKVQLFHVLFRNLPWKTWRIIKDRLFAVLPHRVPYSCWLFAVLPPRVPYSCWILTLTSVECLSIMPLLGQFTQGSVSLWSYLSLCPVLWSCLSCYIRKH